MRFILLNIYLIKVTFFYTASALTSNFSQWIQELEPEVLDYGISKKTFTKTLSQVKDVNKKVLKLYKKKSYLFKSNLNIE